MLDVVSDETFGAETGASDAAAGDADAVGNGTSAPGEAGGVDADGLAITFVHGFVDETGVASATAGTTGAGRAGTVSARVPDVAGRCSARSSRPSAARLTMPASSTRVTEALIDSAMAAAAPTRPSVTAGSLAGAAAGSLAGASAEPFGGRVVAARAAPFRSACWIS